MNSQPGVIIDRQTSIGFELYMQADKERQRLAGEAKALMDRNAQSSTLSPSSLELYANPEAASQTAVENVQLSRELQDMTAAVSRLQSEVQGRRTSVCIDGGCL